VALARRLGSRSTRRRRHLKVAVAAALLCAVAGVLLLVDRGQRAGQPDGLAEACTANNREISTAYHALVDAAVDPDAAVEGFLGDAFVDLVRARADAVDALHPRDPVPGLVDQWRSIADAIEASPADAVTVNPFSAVNDGWRAAGLAACAIDPTTVPGDASGP
jgi:hypothetical protein